jgi:hypothetical protein
LASLTSSKVEFAFHSFHQKAFDNSVACIIVGQNEKINFWEIKDLDPTKISTGNEKFIKGDSYFACS